MSNGKSIQSEKLVHELQAIADAVHDAVQHCQGDAMTILALLRQLEQLHREIRDEDFQKSLPDNRQALYSLLKNIESFGGWPYIERMRLQALLANMPEDKSEEDSNDVVQSDRADCW